MQALFLCHERDITGPLPNGLFLVMAAAHTARLSPAA